MKISYHLLAAVLLGSTGCSTSIYESGRFHDVLQRSHTKEEVRAAIGAPIATQVIQPATNSRFEDCSADLFLAKRPVYDGMRSAAASVAGGTTLGLTEFIYVPKAIWWRLFDRQPEYVIVYYICDGHFSYHFVTAWRNFSSEGKIFWFGNADNAPQATRDGRSSSAARFTPVYPTCLGPGR